MKPRFVMLIGLKRHRQLTQMFNPVSKHTQITPSSFSDVFTHLAWFFAFQAGKHMREQGGRTRKPAQRAEMEESENVSLLVDWRFNQFTSGTQGSWNGLWQFSTFFFGERLWEPKLEDFLCCGSEIPQCHSRISPRNEFRGFSIPPNQSSNGNYARLREANRLKPHNWI